MNWHTLSVEKAFELTSAHAEGLTSSEANIRLAEYGPNELEEKKKKPIWLLFLYQFKDFMIIILLAAAVLSGLLGDLIDTIIIAVIVFLNALIGFIQEYRAEKAMEALKKMAMPLCEVLRDGRPQRIQSSGLVPGDVVLLEAGNSVPADLRITESHSLRIDESALTGESVATDKTTEALSDVEIPLGDRVNMAFKGTLVTNGRGKGLVVATGMETEIGKIARMLQEENEPTPLQRRMADFGKKLTYIILAICALLFVVGMLRGEDLLKMLLVSVSLAVAAIPEALPALITVALARGAARLMKQNALIRKLPAVETLGSVTYICSDKTGTLTQNKMKVVETLSSPQLYSFSDGFNIFEAGLALNHDVKFSSEMHLTGDPTEMALVEYVKGQVGDDKFFRIVEMLPRVAELPFDSDRKCMTTVHRFMDKYIVLCKGAAESIISRLHPSENIELIAKTNTQWADNGWRVLVFAYNIIPSLPNPFTYDTVEKDLKFCGMAAMLDPAREEVKPAINDCISAGIRPVMITGDHPATAAAIARQIGILREGDLVVNGAQLLQMSDHDFESNIEKISVYARVSPEQKLRIVKALQKKNHFVAMTGDGVNDAPSLKAANIGVAMGITGTDVSKEASHMILLDDNFATIVKAVREGRRIYDNIRKFVKYIMTCNSAEIWTIFLAPFLALPIPLLPIHILWINLVTDGLPGLALAGEKEERNIMKRPPRPTNESLFAQGIGLHIVWVGLLMALTVLGVQLWAIKTEHSNWQTIVFTSLAFAQLGHVLAIRTDKEFIFSRGFHSNIQLLGAVLLTVVLQIIVIYWPPANKIFRTQPLSTTEFLICVGVAVIVFHAVEFEKLFRGRSDRRSFSK
ncbi:MAG: cation-translocating P-type ATPase [Chitinophagales bacterium]|nr:cation-translocating P-type ATPase [Chitinophagales bacterium]MDW8274021.1 cation-translocating P-type ATPase [Chitinophagales bacterium]